MALLYMSANVALCLNMYNKKSPNDGLSLVFVLLCRLMFHSVLNSMIDVSNDRKVTNIFDINGFFSRRHRLL